MLRTDRRSCPAHKATIIPRDFPELRMLVWNRDDARPIAPDEALALYERNWRYVDAEHMTEREAKLVEYLVEEFGNGLLLV
jgi:hypothetical protein